MAHRTCDLTFSHSPASSDSPPNAWHIAQWYSRTRLSVVDMMEQVPDPWPVAACIRSEQVRRGRVRAHVVGRVLKEAPIK